MRTLKSPCDEPRASDVRIVFHKSFCLIILCVGAVVHGQPVRVKRAQRRDLFGREMHAWVGSEGDGVRGGDDACGAGSGTTEPDRLKHTAAEEGPGGTFRGVEAERVEVGDAGSGKRGSDFGG